MASGQWWVAAKVCWQGWLELLLLVPAAHGLPGAIRATRVGSCQLSEGSGQKVSCCPRPIWGEGLGVSGLLSLGGDSRFFALCVVLVLMTTVSGGGGLGSG